MAAKKPSASMDFLVSALKANRKASYADLKTKADAKGLQLYPIMFGRAQALLGIVKSAKRGTGRFARANAAKRAGTASATPAAGRRGRQVDPSSKSGKVRALLATGMSTADIAKKVGCSANLVYLVRSTMGRPRGAPKLGPGRPRKTTASIDGIAGILDVVKNAERQRVQLRAALEKIQGVIAGVLSS